MEHLKDYITVNNQQYCISTNNIFDLGLETMVFKSENNRVINWKELFYKHYETEEEAVRGHNYTLNNLEKCLAEGEVQNWQKDTGIDPFNWLNIEKFFERMEEREGK